MAATTTLSDPYGQLSNAGADELPAPVTKLDADQYDAEDQGGLTDTAAGTGNLNYALLQSALRRDAQSVEGDAFMTGLDDQSSPDAPAYQAHSLKQPSSTAPSPGYEGALSAPDLSPADASSSSAATIGARTTSDGRAISAVDGEPGVSGAPPLAGGDGTGISGGGFNGSNGKDGANGKAVALAGEDGEDGQDGEGGSTYINNTTVVNNTYQAGDVVTNHYSETTETNNNTYTYEHHETNVTNVSNTYHTTTNTTNTTTNTTNNTVNVSHDDHSITIINIDHDDHHHHDHDHDHDDDDDGEGEDGNDGPQDHDLSLGLLGQDLDLLLNPVESLLGDIDTVGVVDLDLFDNSGTDNSQGDADLVLGTQLETLAGPLATIVTGVTLDSLEQVVGDIDINLGSAVDLLGAVAPGLTDDLPGGAGGDPLLGGAVGSLVGDLTGLGATGPHGDRDLSLDLNAGAATIPVDAVANVLLNPVEDLVGDIDLDLAPDLQLLNDGASEPGSIDLVGDIDLGGIDLLEGQHVIDLGPLSPIIGGNTTIVAGLDLLGSVADPVVDGVTGGTGTGTLLSGLGHGVSELVEGVLGSGGSPDDTDLTLNTGLNVVDHSLVQGVDQLTLNPVEDLAGDVDLDLTPDLQLLNGNTAESGSITLIGDADLGGTALLQGQHSIDLGILSPVIGGDTNIGAGLDLLGNVADPVVNDAAGGTGAETLLSGVGQGLSGLAEGLLGSGDAAGDTDLALNTGLEIVDHGLIQGVDHLNLNVVEDIAGDADIAIGGGINLFGASDDAAGDSDLSLSGDLGVNGGSSILPEIALNLDPVEHLVGDIDLSINVAADLLQPVAAPVVDNHAGGSADGLITSLLSEVHAGVDAVVASLPVPSIVVGAVGTASAAPVDHGQTWTEVTLPQTVDHVLDAVSHATGSVLPDPVSTVAHGLGGLFDNHHETGSGHHGLFG